MAIAIFKRRNAADARFRPRPTGLSGWPALEGATTAAQPAAEATYAAQRDNRIRKKPKCRDKYGFLASMRQTRFPGFRVSR
jgi:hypothetical protein